MTRALIAAFIRSPLLALIVTGALVGWGWAAFLRNPKDAIPDISDNQVIVFTKWMGRSPKDVDEQVTYPLTVALQGVPEVREVRATSGFGWSIVYTVFHDQADFYWARSRVLEQLNVASGELPEGVTPSLGPDATALGQVFWYTVENGWYAPANPGLRFTQDGTLTEPSRRSLEQSDPMHAERIAGADAFTDPLTGQALVPSQLPLDELRSIQDFDVKLALQSVEGVSEVASVGGYVRQYQIDVNPEALRAFDVSLNQLVGAVRSSNVDVGAKVVEQNDMEVLIRGVGFLGGGDRSTGSRSARESAALRDIENIVVKATAGAPIFVRQLAKVSTGPDFRRGALDKSGAEAVGGCVIMRFGEDPLTVIEGVKDKVAMIEAGLPPGVRINAFYDRSKLIHQTMATLGEALSQELLITIVAVMLFLLHFRSSMVIAVTLPLAILFAFICMEALAQPSNIMSLAGIAIAIGTMVDMGIVMTENVYQHLTDRHAEFVQIVPGANGDRHEKVDAMKRTAVIEDAATEVGPAIVTAVTTTVISFLPVFFLEGQAAKLFTPLAWTKTFCMTGAVLLTLTVVPPFASLMLRRRRVRKRWTTVWAMAAGLVATAGWTWMSRWFPETAAIRTTVERMLSLSPNLTSATIGVIAFALAWIILRERIRPMDRNPVSRFIRFVYEPTLRWILLHKVLFSSVPLLIVAWGTAIWLGWEDVLRVLIAPFRLFGVSVESWSWAWWVHLTLGVLFGLILLPLVIDSVRTLLARRRPRAVRRPLLCSTVGKVICVAGAVAATMLLDGINVADRNASALGSVFTPPPADPATNEPLLPSQHEPMAQTLASDTGIGQEFMPPLDEGDFLYMPSVLPAGSINTVLSVMQKQDVQFVQIPEVAQVVGKLGRIESALDPAPVGMLETVILLKPREEWPLIEDTRFPGRMRKRTMDEIWAQIQEAGRFPGVLPSVQLQPIRTRIEMLSTGLNAKIGIKVYGDSLEQTERLAVRIEQVLRSGLENAEAINAIRTSGKPYLEFRIDREAMARYGVNITDVQSVIEVAIGGINLTTTYEGLDRYPVRVRYQRELRDDLPDLRRVLVPTPTGAQIPITQVSEISSVVGPMSVRREGAKYVSYVTMNNVGVDETTLVRNGQTVIDRAIIDGTLDIPDGYFLKWSGSYERNIRAKRRLAMLIPLVLLINLCLIYLQFKQLPLSLIVFAGIPVGFAGGFILLHYWPQVQDMLFVAGLMDRPFQGDAIYLTVAVWIGFIALFGIAVDDGIVIGTYLDQVFSRSKIRRYEEIADRVVEAGLRRIRPCLMTTFTTLIALLPVLMSTGRGSDVMAPMALPVFGGMMVGLISLFVVPTCYCAVMQWKWRLGLGDQDFDRST